MMSRHGNLPLDFGPRGLVWVGMGISEAIRYILLKASTKALGAWGHLEGMTLKG